MASSCVRPTNGLRARSSPWVQRFYQLWEASEVLSTTLACQLHAVLRDVAFYSGRFFLDLEHGAHVGAVEEGRAQVSQELLNAQRNNIVVVGDDRMVARIAKLGRLADGRHGAFSLFSPQFAVLIGDT